MAVNSATVIGNLGATPEVRTLPSGQSVANLSLATTERFTDRTGGKQQRTEWHRIVAFDKLGEICGQYLGKGKQVMIEGRIEYGSYEKDGVKHYTTDIVAENMTMLGSPGGRGQDREPEPPFGPPQGGTPDDDIPF